MGNFDGSNITTIQSSAVREAIRNTIAILSDLYPDNVLDVTIGNSSVNARKLTSYTTVNYQLL